MSYRIYFDTAPLIYFLDKAPLYYTKMRDFLFENINNESQFYTSVLTDMEYLVYPYKKLLIFLKSTIIKSLQMI